MERASSSTSDERLRDMVARLQETRARAISSATTLTERDDVVLVDTTSGSVTVTLPSARLAGGHVFHVKKMIAANTCTVSRSGSDTIDGATTSAWTTQYECRTFASVIVTAPATWGWVVLG
jgi:hypothetical protein